MPYTPDITGRGEATGTLARRGMVTAAALVVLLVLVLMQYRGLFRTSFPARALVPDVGDGVGVGADIKLRGVLVGEVAGVRLRAVPGGPPLHEVDMALDPSKAAGIPAGVTARVVPTNVFGAPSLELLDPKQPETGTLARNAVISADTSQATLQLQTVINQTYRVLTAVKPAELNVALTNIAQSLQGRGSEIGSLISNGDQYTTALNAQTPEFNELLRQLGPSVQSLNDNAPELLDAVDNLVASGQTFLRKRDQLVRVLTQTPEVADHTDTLLHQIDDPALHLLSDAHGVGALLAGQYQNIPAALRSLQVAIPTLQEGLTGGLNLTVNLLPFTPYTAADCPRYHELKGPNCGKPVPPATQLPPGFPFFEQRPGQLLPTPPQLLPGQPKAAPVLPKAKKDDDGSPKGLLPGLFGSFSPSSYPAGPTKTGVRTG